MDKLYSVFEIDTFFGEYGCGYDLVGAESVEDVLDHFKEIYPDRKIMLERPNYLGDAAWDSITEHGKYKEGDVIVYPEFDEEQMAEFRASLNPDHKNPRIVKRENMFTDKPYKMLVCYGYEE